MCFSGLGVLWSSKRGTRLGCLSISSHNKAFVRHERIYIAFERGSGLEALPGEGEPFFGDSGQMSDAVARRVEALQATFAYQRTTYKAVDSLAEAGVLVRWPDALVTSLGMTLAGLYMIDEQALAQLDDNVFLSLRRAQALPIAYALNLSLMQTHVLARLARVSPLYAAIPDNLTEVFGSDDEELCFDFEESSLSRFTRCH